MANAFGKIGVFSDIHFGEHGDSKEHNEFCLEFLEWAIMTAKLQGCDTIAFMGDWHHHRNKVGAETLNYSHQGVTMLNECGLPVYFIIGNHDLFYKDNRSVHSIPFLNEMENITVINEVTKIGNSLFVPWLCTNDDFSLVTDADVKYMFGHFELSSFKMNEAYVMPESDHTLGPDAFSSPEYVFSGHFHGRQKRVNKKGTVIYYIGNCFPHSFSDEGDTDRGMMILEQDGEPEFMAWPNQPTYRKVPLTKFLENPDCYNTRTRIKIVQDIDMSPAERVELRKMVGETYDLHNVSIEPMKVEVDISSIKLDLENEENIDKVVVEYIKQMEPTEGLDPAKLIQIYIEAGR